MTTKTIPPFESFKNKVRANGVRFSCVSQIKDEMGHSVERWMAITPGSSINMIAVINPEDGTYSLYLENGSIRIDDDVAAVCKALGV